MSSPEDFLFRETALCRFPDPEERETLQRFGSLVLSWAVGAEHGEEGKATQTGSSLAAVAADLRHLSQYRRAVVDEVEGNVVEPAEAHLGFLAKRWVPRVAVLAREVESAVEAAEAPTAAVQAGTDPEAAPAGTGRDLTAQEIRRLADRCSWVQMALLNARGVEAALQAIPKGRPDPALHRHLLVRASDLCTEMELLLRNEGCPARDGES
ncbi:MAG TPA: hypothetical protein VLF66_15920 [Thermoanaerobaculia bacterium]|nr:hypothetical protein [Thermoanaerobaculia bacterium]